MYFPNALLAVAAHSKKANDKHNPGEPLHWSKEKSSDHADCIGRHLLDIGPNWDAIDPEFGSLHATALAWRALALLETVLTRNNIANAIIDDHRAMRRIPSNNTTGSKMDVGVDSNSISVRNPR